MENKKKNVNESQVESFKEQETEQQAQLNSSEEGETPKSEDTSTPEIKEIRKAPPKEIVAEETGVISVNTKVIGDIETKGHLAIYGEVEGNVTARGDIVATGKIAGDITCNSLKMTGCQVKTNISVKEMFILDENTRVEGRIQCKNISVDGTVKGDIDAQGEINIYKNAKIIGSIKTRALGIESGAEIQGNVMVVK